MAVMFEKKRKKKKPANTIEAYDPNDWEAGEDARALARAKAVKCDPERLKRAQAWAKNRLDEHKQRKEEAQAMMDLAMDDHE